MMKKAGFLFGAAVAALTFAGCGHDDGSKDFEIGRAAIDERDWVAASSALDRATKACPTNTAAWFYLAVADIELGNTEAADFAIKSAGALDPTSPEILVCDARVAFLLKDYERASRDWTLVAADPSVSAEVRAKAYSDLGALAIVNNEREEARLNLFRGLRIDMKNPQIWYHLGKLYRDSFRFDREALECFEFFARLAPDTDEFKQRVKDRIIPDLKASIANEMAEIAGTVSKPDAGKAATAIVEGNKLVQQNKLSAAIKKYEDALKADPLSGPAALALAQTLESYATTPQTNQKAFSAWKTAANLSPNSKTTLVGAGKMALKVGHWSEAATLLSRALAKDHEDVKTLELLETAYRKCGHGKIADAYKAYRRSLAK